MQVKFTHVRKTCHMGVESDTFPQDQRADRRRGGGWTRGRATHRC
jgi:hypothetical protein